ncbi:MAG TPA: gamma-glutamyltransferase family protein [Chloroflexota bacterium]|nr:gamma-glutamyltransferase family protein [Chloroflexota bacterium]
MAMDGTRWQPARGCRGVVATPHYLATQAGMQMYARGGNAVDAAVAANAALCVVQPHQCGLGGDAFVLLRPAGGTPVVLNGSGRTPAALTPERVRAAGHAWVPARGGLAVTVPGAVRAWGDLLARYGRLGLDRVLAPAIGYATDGFPVSAALSRAVAANREALAAQPGAARAYLPGGEPIRPGRPARFPDLARTLTALARDGADAFYGGPLADAMVQAVGAAGGVLTLDDLAAHASVWQEPLRVAYRGCTVYQCPPNSQGLATIIQLGLLAGEDVRAAGHLSAESLDLLVSATRVAIEERDHRIGDPSLVPPPPATGDVAAWGSRLTALRTSAATAAASQAALPSADTVYLAAADADGNVVSLIESLWVPFGSGVIAGDTGVFLHNRAAHLPVDGVGPRAVAPSVRPPHTLMPGLAEGADRIVALGSRGGDGQPQTQLQLLTALLDYDLDVQAAVEAPRWLYGGIEPRDPRDVLHVEARVPPTALDALRRRGYTVDVIPDWNYQVGIAQIAGVDADGVLSAAADPRGDGAAAAC